jgi:hypothetical protein
LKADSSALDNGEGGSSAPDREKGEQRNEPCLGCLRSLIFGKGNRKCFNNLKNSMITAYCHCCASGHSCVEIPRSVLLLASETYILIHKTGKSSDQKAKTKVKHSLKLCESYLMLSID